MEGQWQHRTQKREAANRKIRGQFRRIGLEKTGFRPVHLFPIKVSNSSISSDIIREVFHWLLVEQSSIR